MAKAIGRLIGIAWNIVVALTLVEVINPSKGMRIGMAVTLLVLTGASAISAISSDN